VQNASTSALGDLVLVSSHLTEQNDAPGTYYQEWFGEVRNASAMVYCYVNIQISIAPGPGLPLSLKAYADTSTPYQVSGLSLSVPCIPPGGTGALWANNISSSTANFAASTSFAYQLTGTPMSDAVPSVASPTVTDAVQTDGVLGYDVAGTVAAVAGISNIEVDAYVRDATGLFVARLSDVDLGSLATGQSWSFQTTTTSEAFVSHYDAVSFATAITPRAIRQPHPLAIVGGEVSLSGLLDDARQLSAQRAQRATAAGKAP
jgi:hypothetical protein